MSDNNTCSSVEDKEKLNMELLVLKSKLAKIHVEKRNSIDGRTFSGLVGAKAGQRIKMSDEIMKVVKRFEQIGSSKKESDEESNFERNINSEEAKELFEEANILYKNGEYEKVLDMCQKAIQLEQDGKNDPKFLVEVLSEVACCYFWMNKYDKQIEVLTCMIELDPHCSSHYSSRSNIYYMHLENYQKALEDAESALKLDSSNIEAKELREMCLEQLDSKKKETSQEAENSYQKAVDCYNANKYEESLDLCEKAIDFEKLGFNRSEVFVKILTTMSNCYNDLKMHDKQLAVLNCLIELNPLDAKLKLMRNECLDKLNGK